MSRTRAADSIDNTQDIIDSRDVIERIKYLEAQAKALREEYEATRQEMAENGENVDTIDQADFSLDEDEQNELNDLLELERQAGHGDWTYGAVLIRDSYFEEYAQEEAESMYGRELGEARWPFSYIDWSAAADALKQDYTRVEFAGETYWVRA